MTIFPTQYSLLSASALKDVLESNYGFNGMSCRLLLHNVSDTYILENSTSKYIFKIYRDAHRKLEEIKGEVELLNQLSAGGAKVSFPICDLKGEQIQAFHAAEGIRNGVLFSYATGQVFSILSEEQLVEFGREMAKVHDLTSIIELPYPRKAYTIETTLTIPLSVVKPAFETLPEEYAYLETTASEVIDRLKQLDPEKFSYGYCHYDFFAKNFHFDEDGQVTFFDFDFAGQGYLASDITSFYIHLFAEVTYHKMTREAADRAFEVFITAYRTVRPFTEEELRAIRDLGFAFWLFYMGFHAENFEDWSNPFFGPKYLKDRVSLIKKWMEF